MEGPRGVDTGAEDPCALFDRAAEARTRAAENRNRGDRPLPRIPTILNFSQIAGCSSSSFATLRNTPPHSAPQSSSNFSHAQAMGSNTMARKTPGAIGSRVARLRKQAGLSVVGLAKKAELNRAVIERLENGDVQSPQAPTVFALANALGVTVDDLDPGGEESEHGNGRTREDREG